MRHVGTQLPARSLLVLLAVLLAGTQAWSQTAEKAAAAPAAAPATEEAKKEAFIGQEAKAPTFDEKVKQIKNPVPWLNWGFDQRLRQIYANNFTTLDQHTVGHEKNFMRARSRLWATFTPAENVEIDTRLLWEWRIWSSSNDNGYDYAGNAAKGPGLANPSSVNFDEAVFDHLNFKLKNLADTPTTLTVGRQDIIFGNGWLVLDGTPLDGSRSIFFDAVRLNTQIEEKTKLDLVWIEQQAATDQWISPFNDQERNVTEQNERGAIAYLTNNSVENMQIEGFYIWKHDNYPNLYPGAVPAQYPPFWARESDLHTVGGRLSGAFDKNWKYRTEAAQQMGQQAEFGMGPGQDICAFGSNSRLSYLFNDAHNNDLHVGYEFLSGDFDPLWGRWPQWSELYIYTYSAETRIAETTNLHRVQMGWDTDLTKKFHFTTDYNLLWSDGNTHGNPLATKYWGPDGGYSDNGEFRGQLLVTKLIYKFNQYISGHLWGEYFFPGNFYTSARNDPAVFLRYELMITF